MTEQTNNRVMSIWESNVDIDQKEHDPDVDGVNVLAKVSGPAFFPDTTSRNLVHYSKEAWENAIADEAFQKRLANRQVLGTIGHDLELDDTAVRSGNFSHIVTKIWIDENNIGQAEYLILNTPPGRVLNTILRAKSKIYVSTKANGEFEKVDEGVKYVNPNVFFLERIDFVLDPGYLQTNPQLLEAYNRSLEVDEMSDKSTINESTSEINETLNKYKQLGSPEAISKCLDLLESYIKIGSVDNIKKSLDESNDKINKLTNIISKNFSDVTEALNFETMKTLLEQYKELGTVNEVKQLIKVAIKQHKIIAEAQAKELAKTYNVSESFIRRTYNKGMSMNEIQDMLEDLQNDLPPSAKPIRTTDVTDTEGTEDFSDEEVLNKFTGEDGEEPEDAESAEPQELEPASESYFCEEDGDDEGEDEGEEDSEGEEGDDNVDINLDLDDGANESYLGLRKPRNRIREALSSKSLSKVRKASKAKKTIAESHSKKMYQGTLLSKLMK